MTMEKRCISCDNHCYYEFKCLINHPNYMSNESVDLSKCFVQNSINESMDKMLSTIDRMHTLLDKRK